VGAGEQEAVRVMGRVLGAGEQEAVRAMGHGGRQPGAKSPPESFIFTRSCSHSFFFFFFWFWFWFLRDRVSLCSPGCPGTHSVDQAGLELRNPPVSAS
jgi:hypothetical protein